MIWTKLSPVGQSAKLTKFIRRNKLIVANKTGIRRKAWGEIIKQKPTQVKEGQKTKPAANNRENPQGHNHLQIKSHVRVRKGARIAKTLPGVNEKVP